MDIEPFFASRHGQKFVKLIDKRGQDWYTDAVAVSLDSSTARANMPQIYNLGVLAWLWPFLYWLTAIAVSRNTTLSMIPASIARR
jgi:hypothetical protein